MQYAPAVESSNPKQKLQVGNFNVILFDNIIARGPVKYLYMMVAYDDAQQPCLYVTSEVNPMLCEWTQDRAHLNYDQGPPVEINAFCKAVEQLLKD